MVPPKVGGKTFNSLYFSESKDRFKIRSFKPFSGPSIIPHLYYCIPDSILGSLPQWVMFYGLQTVRIQLLISVMSRTLFNKEG